MVRMALWLVVSMSISHAAGHWFVHGPGHNKDNHKNGSNCLSAWHTGIRVGLSQHNLTV